MTIKENDLVMVIVEHPDGSNTKTYGDIGVVTKIEKINEVYNLTVHTKSSDYIYGQDQVRVITDEEARLALQALLTK